jgi:hypothetical protein
MKKEKRAVTSEAKWPICPNQPRSCDWIRPDRRRELPVIANDRGCLDRDRDRAHRRASYGPERRSDE